MKKVLFIYSSPLIGSEQGSISMLLAKKFKDAYIKKNDSDQIIELDLNHDQIGSKTLLSTNLSTFFNHEDSDTYIKQLREVNKVVVVAPMINFNYPSALKNYLDHVLVAGKTFFYKYDRDGESEGLLKHLKVQLLTTQGANHGWYPWGNHTANLKGTWEFMGAEVLSPITIFGTKTPQKIVLSIEEIVGNKNTEIKQAVENF